MRSPVSHAGVGKRWILERREERGWPSYGSRLCGACVGVVGVWRSDRMDTPSRASIAGPPFFHYPWLISALFTSTHSFPHTGGAVGPRQA